MVTLKANQLELQNVYVPVGSNPECLDKVVIAS
jgi:hypothetical protein